MFACAMSMVGQVAKESDQPPGIPFRAQVMYSHSYRAYGDNDLDLYYPSFQPTSLMCCAPCCVQPTTPFDRDGVLQWMLEAASRGWMPSTMSRAGGGGPDEVSPLTRTAIRSLACLHLTHRRCGTVPLLASRAWRRRRLGVAWRG